MQADDSDKQGASNRAVDLLAVASHEIRTPLGAVLTTAEALLQSGLDEQQTKYATTLRDAAAALLTLSNTLLDATAPSEFGGQDIFSPGDLVASVASLYEVKASAKGLRLDVDCAVDADYSVSGYPGPVRQVLTNLVDNALKYTSAGFVRVSLSREAEGSADRIEIRVSDSGSGIADTDRDRIFSPYSRLDSGGEPGARGASGQGLGLWVAKRTAEKLGGDLSVETSSPAGTTFCFSAPVSPQALQRNKASSPKPDRPEIDAGDGYSVLVVDDNDAALTLADVVITAFGWTVTPASSGEQALELINNALDSAPDTFDCVLTDLAMPGMNGIDLAHAIEALGPAVRIPVLAVSAINPSHFGTAGETGLCGYVPKPYTPDLLYRTLVEAIRANGLKRT